MAEANSEEKVQEVKPLDDLSLKDLKDLLKTKYNFEGVDDFNTRKQALNVLSNYQKMEQKRKEDSDDIPAKPIEDKMTPEGVRNYKSKAERQKAFYDKQPKVRFFIPLDPGEKKYTVHPIQINGYRVNIPKGVTVQIAEGLADELERQFNMTSEAGKEFELDRDPNVRQALE